MWSEAGDAGRDYIWPPVVFFMPPSYTGRLVTEHTGGWMNTFTDERSRAVSPRPISAPLTKRCGDAGDGQLLPQAMRRRFGPTTSAGVRLV